MQTQDSGQDVVVDAKPVSARHPHHHTPLRPDSCEYLHSIPMVSPYRQRFSITPRLKVSLCLCQLLRGRAKGSQRVQGGLIY